MDSQKGRQTDGQKNTLPELDNSRCPDCIAKGACKYLRIINTIEHISNF